jgi:hypothetical protein
MGPIGFMYGAFNVECDELELIATRTGHRKCTDEEYNQQRRCWTCRHYSFKAYSSDDENSGKCLVLCAPGVRNILWTEGKDIAVSTNLNNARPFHHIEDKTMTYPHTVTDHEELVLILPEDARRALIELLGKLSRDDLTQRGLNVEQCDMVDRVYHSLF